MVRDHGNAPDFAEVQKNPMAAMQQVQPKKRLFPSAKDLQDPRQQGALARGVLSCAKAQHLRAEAGS